ncbi:MAG TPA: RcnB family protein [Lysobacter sp.]|jgi:Ni/Co efflux regulator RcnB|nr:RcnB family protein [Lysobacter sp.]
MKRLLLALSFASLLLTSAAALADHHHHDHDGYYYDHDDDDDDDDGRYYDHPGKHKGWKKHREYHRGERIEVVYLEPRYYVDDYDYYRLRQPPRGHRWVRTDDGRFILVAVATGIIADILLHH